MIFGRDVYYISFWLVNYKFFVVLYVCKSVYVYGNEIKKMNVIDLDFIGYVGLLIMRIV